MCAEDEADGGKDTGSTCLFHFLNQRNFHFWYLRLDLSDFSDAEHELCRVVRTAGRYGGAFDPDRPLSGIERISEQVKEIDGVEVEIEHERAIPASS